MTSTATATATANSTATPPPVDDSVRNTHVVHIGDSFVHAGLQQALRPRFAAVGARYHVLAKTSAYTTSFGADKDFDEAIARRPDLVLITLGANEYDDGVPESHARAIRALAKKASVAPCVWIAPPSWKKDTGILRVIRDNAGPCLYFDSDALVGDVPRQRDGIHPSKEGGARWAAAFFDWLAARRVPGARWQLRAGAP